MSKRRKSVSDPRPRPRSRTRARAKADGDATAMRQARYWKRRLIRRKYTEELSPGAGPALSVRIEYEGTSQYFPLGTEEPHEAAARALSIHRTVLSEGWDRARARFPREVTVAVFWSTDPLACTYTTLFTATADDAATRPGLGGTTDGVATCVVEGDDGVRRAMTRCLGRHDGFRCVAALATGKDALRACRRAPLGLVLVSRSLPDMAGTECVGALRALRPELPVFTYGVHDDSDQLFLSFSGVSAGYMLRRRPPGALLDPIGRLPARLPMATPPVGHRIKTYFQDLFSSAPLTEAVPGMMRLTYREQEILEHLSRGYVDKEIAGKLGISAWTVHGHLKRIFEKLEVHTRTEAVVTYLQK